MIYYLDFDEENYLAAIATVGGGVEAEINLNDYDLSGNRMRAHRWEDNTLVFDEEKYAEILAEQEAQEREKAEQPISEIEQLRADVDYLAVMTGVEL